MRKLSKSKIILLMSAASVLVLILLPQLTQAQCSMCRAVVGSNLESGDGVSAFGINNAILYLMAAPYIVVAVVGYRIFNANSQAKKPDQ